MTKCHVKTQVPAHPSTQPGAQQAFLNVVPALPWPVGCPRGARGAEVCPACHLGELECLLAQPAWAASAPAPKGQGTRGRRRGLGTRSSPRCRPPVGREAVCELARSRGLSAEVSALPLQRPGSHPRTWPPTHPQAPPSRWPGPGRTWAEAVESPRARGTRASFTARGRGAPAPGPGHVAEDGAAGCRVSAPCWREPASRRCWQEGEGGRGVWRAPAGQAVGYAGGAPGRGGWLPGGAVCGPRWGGRCQPSGRAGRRVCVALAFLLQRGGGGLSGKLGSVLRALETPGLEASLYS